MKKLFTLLTLLVAIVTGAWAQTGTALSDLNFSYPTALPTAYTFSSANTPTIATIGGKSSVYVANGGGTSIPTFSSDNTAPTGGKRWMAFCPAEDCDVKISVYSNKKTFYIWDKDKKTTSDAVASYTNSAQAWEDWEVEGLKAGTWYVIGAGNSQCYVGAMTFTAAVSDGKTNLVGAWSSATSNFDFGSTATAPTFAVTGGTATAGTDYSVAYALTTDGGNVTVNSTSGITAIDTNTPGTSKVKATITVKNETDYKATTTEYETTITVNPEQTAPAGGKYTITFNGKDEGDTDYFTNVGKHSFNTKFKDATYDGKAFTSGLKMEGTTEIDFTTTAATSIVTIVQSTWSDTGIAFDDNTVASSTATAGTGYRVYTFTNVAAGSHSMKRGSAAESGIFQITVEEIAATNAPVITVDPASAEYATGATADALTVSATASAGNLSYQWYSNTTASNEGGTEIAEATSANYTPSTATAGTYYYYVVVSDDNGSATSKVATITVVDASAPTSVTISGAPTAAVALNQVVKLTATVEGAVPDATVDWLDESDNVLKSATTTYTVPTTAIGEVKVKARATNESGSVSSDLVTINVIDPNKNIEANEYFISVDEQVYPNEKITGTDIALTFVNGKAGESFTAGVSDNMISGENSNYVASISGSQSNNGWKAQFEPTANGILKVGVVINNNKTFSIAPAANVTSFSYKGKNNADPQEAVEETVEGNSLTTGEAATDKLYVEVTLNVEANKEYSFSVAGSKMGFYGFTFTPTVPVIITSAGAASFSSTEALDFSAVEGITAYKATAKSDSYVHLDEVAQVPAGAGVIVKGAQGTYNVPVATGDVAELEGNLLVGTGENTFKVTSAEYGKVFKYVKTNAGVVGFQKAKVDWTCQAGHAYLMLSEPQAREFIGIFGEEVVTGIDAIENGTIDNDAPAYNLAGQKVGKGYKGIVIINGKKVVK